MKKPAVKITVTVLAAIAAILLALHITAVAVISSEYDGDGGFSAFLWAESELGKYKLKEIFTKIKYKFTGELDFNGVVNSGEYLFPTDKEPFDYVSDAEGTLSFSEEESRAILDQMLMRREAHALDGAEFYVFVIPNSQTVLKNGPPFGSAGAVSRAEKLSEYLKQNGFEDFYILDEAFEPAGYEPFHNTENAVNGYGAYLSFEYIVSRLPEQLTRRMNEITAGEDDVKVYYTDGRSLAEKVKLQKVIKNKTVYFDTEKLEKTYNVSSESGLVLCALKDEYNDFLGNSCVLIESYDKYELDLMKPLFAAAFSNTCFKDDLSYSRKAAEISEASAVVCLVREDRLNVLLGEYDAQTYRAKLGGESGYTEAPYHISVVPMTPHTALIAGYCEEDSEIFIETEGSVYTVKAAYGRFFAEVPADSKEKTVRITAKAGGKAVSDAVNAEIRTSPGVSREADVGKTSMLYYTQTVRDYTGSNLYSERRLQYIKNGFVSYISNIRAVTGKNTKVIFLVAPDPLSIYQDAASDTLLAKRADNTRLGQVAEALSDIDGLTFIDLREQMKMNTDIGKLYYQTDTHWTELGAYFGYRAVVTAISADFPAVSPLPLNAFEITEKTVDAGDLSSFAGLAGFTENVKFLNPVYAYKAIGVPAKPDTIDRSGYTAEFTSRTGNAAYPTALVVRDSYSANLFPMLSEHFNTLYCQQMWKEDTDEAKLAELRADYVIIVCSERNLDSYVR